MGCDHVVQILDHNFLAKVLIQTGIGQITARIDQRCVPVVNHKKLVGLHAVTTRDVFVRKALMIAIVI